MLELPSRMSHPPVLPAPLYQGSVNTWECDEGGHLNIRFHLERAMVGLAHMAAALEVPRSFKPRTNSTLIVREVHVRFLKEALPGAALVMHGGVVALDQSDATLCFDMRHADGAPSSCFTMKVSHAETRDWRAFPWSMRTRAAAERLTCAPPAHGQARSLDLSVAPSDASRARAIELGASRIGASVVTPDQCDAFGRLRTDHFLGRISDAVPNLLSQWRREAAATNISGMPAGAVVEARLVCRRYPRMGDLVEVHSGVAHVGEKTFRLVHWLCDPVSGVTYASMEGVALTFDTATRKTITPSAEARAVMEKRVVAMAV